MSEVPGEESIYPSGVYISLDMVEESFIALKKYMDKYIPNLEHNEEQHCTLIYSKKEHKEEIIPKEYQVVGTFLRFSKFGENNEVLVAELDCNAMVLRNAELVKKYGFVSDYDEYKPHFTLSYDAKDIDINSLPPIDFAIYFNNETVEPLDENWSNKASDDEKLDGVGTMVGQSLAKHKDELEKEKKKQSKEKE